MAKGAAAQVDFTAIAQWAERLTEIGSLHETHHDTLLQALSEARRGRLDQPPEPLLTVLLFGPSGVGKSQLLNALAGTVLASSHFLRPTTRMPTVYAHEAVRAERLFAYGTALGKMTRFPATCQRHGREELRHVVIIDAPDIDSYVPEHREQVRQLLPAVDIVLYVVTPESYKNDPGWQTVLQERGRHAFAFVMNKWDSEGKRRSPAGQTDVDDDFLDMLRQRAGYVEPLLFRVSSAYWVARHAQDATDISLAPGEQFPELQRWLINGLATSQAEDIQRRRRRALWSSLATAAAAAQPVAVADTPWPETMRRALARLRADGWHMLRPTIATRARILAHADDLELWPHSPGPFGLCLRAMASLCAFFRSLGELRTSRSWPNRRQSRLPSQEVAPSEETEPVLDRLRRLMDERLVSLEWQARQHKVPSQWLCTRWRQLVEAVPAQLAIAVERAATELYDRPFGRLRYALGVLVMAVMELLLSAFLLLVVWRLGTAFVSADYLGVVFVVNAVTLLGCILLFGYVALSCCFPRAELLWRRRLEAGQGSAWEQIMDQMESTATDFLVECDQLYQQGQEIMQALATAISACGPAPDTLFTEGETDTKRLFAPAAQ